jgi:hypothetical protein
VSLYTTIPRRGGIFDKGIPEERIQGRDDRGPERYDPASKRGSIGEPGNPRHAVIRSPFLARVKRKSFRRIRSHQR